MKKVILPFLILISVILNGQTVISNSGEVLNSNNYILSYTIGETVTELLTSNDNILSQGFHQPSVLITSILEQEDFAKQIKVFPNPTTEEVNIEISFLQKEQIKITLFDLSGKVLKSINKSVIEDLIRLKIEDFPSGQYFLELKSKSNFKKQSYKIIKP